MTREEKVTVVLAMRQNGARWDDCGAAVGVSRQTAREMYHRAVGMAAIPEGKKPLCSDDAIVALRREGLTQDAIARRLGVSQYYISKRLIALGMSDPDKSAAMAAARARMLERELAEREGWPSVDPRGFEAAWKAAHGNRVWEDVRIRLVRPRPMPPLPVPNAIGNTGAMCAAVA